jgi:hypothetical protein
MSTSRDYNEEIKETGARKYAYGFDFDVMHPFMVRSFQPFFRPGNLLELGSFKGDFTRRLLPHFDDITCVEASSEAIAEGPSCWATRPPSFTRRSSKRCCRRATTTSC